MTWRESLTNAEQTLMDAGVEDARTNAEYLTAHVLSLKNRSDLRQMLDQEISDLQADAFDQFIARRAKREPLQYILGEWEFFGSSIKVTSAALIPRPETEILVEQALSEAAKMSSSISVLDIGTGTGCIALAIAKHLPSASVLGIDVSSGAIGLANDNAALLGIANVRFSIGDIFSNDWLNSIPGKYDLIVSNPPYISQTEFNDLEPELNRYEPRLALTDESDGLKFYRRIAEIAPKLLTKRGRLLMEIGFGASGTVEEILRLSRFEIIRMTGDLAGIPRIITAELSLAKSSKIAQ